VLFIFFRGSSGACVLVAFEEFLELYHQRSNVEATFMILLNYRKLSKSLYTPIFNNLINNHPAIAKSMAGV
jgi:hypothetical protein